MPRQPRLLTMILLACALFLRVAVPAGWMPSTSGGALAIEPCVECRVWPFDSPGLSA